MRRQPLGAAAAFAGAALVLAPGGALAQTGDPVTSRAAVHAVSYTFATRDQEISLTQIAAPIAVVYQATSRLRFDLATAYVRVDGRQRAGSTRRDSDIAGPTDSQLRASLVFGQDAVIVTVGANLPTGQATATEEQFLAAGLIGNDFLLFPISSMGSGLAGTGGVALARSFGAWNAGAGASMRRASGYEPYEFNGVRARYQPGDEYRARIGVDRVLGDGRLALGATWSTFGSDVSGSTSFATGDRLVTQAGWTGMLRGGEYHIVGWNLHRSRGERVDGSDAPAENIANVMAGAGYALRGLVIEPNAEYRTLHGRGRSGSMATAGLRARWARGLLQLAPAGSYSAGKLDALDVRGWRATITVRLGR